MLLKILILRMTPIMFIGRVKERKKKKLTMAVLVMMFLILGVLSTVEILKQKHWSGVLYLVLSMFPHSFLYLLSYGLLSRCVWKIWSERVWKRVYFVSIILVIVGILSEMYVNPQILQVLLKNFN